MGEDFDNHRRIFDGLSLVEGAAMIFKVPPQFGQCSMSKTRLSSVAQLIRAGKLGDGTIKASRTIPVKLRYAGKEKNLSAQAGKEYKIPKF